MKHMDNTWKTDSKTKKLAYVEVYEKLYGFIKDGTYPVGSKLPPEPQLAQMLGVSRMTLRQALGLLHDDGLLKKVQGAGNFVMNLSRPEAGGLEKYGHPVYKCLNRDVDVMELDFRIEAPTPFTTKFLKRKSPVVISVDRWYYTENRLAAYTYTMIPVETISQFDIDLNDREALKTFVETDIYERSKRSNLLIQPNAEGVAILKDKMPKNAHVTLLLENIYGDDCLPLLHNKHYILTQEAGFEFNVYKGN